MIQNSFCLLDKVGLRKERRLWSQGVNNWNDFLKKKRIKGIASEKKRYFDRQLLRAKEQLHEEDSRYFARVLPQREHWRLYNYFKEECVYLDIEVDHVEGDVLAIGLYNGRDVHTMTRQDMNLDLVREELKKYKLLVSFNGSVFDAPFIKKRYPRVIPNIPHVDLRFGCARVGLKGSLKDIERELGIQRPDMVAKMYGGDAYLLWRKYLATGDEYFLQLFIQYNQEDVLNLEKIAHVVVKRLEEQCKSI